MTNSSPFTTIPFACALFGRVTLKSALISGGLASSAVAATASITSDSNTRVELSPQIGTGRLSTGEEVRHATGYGVALSHAFPIPWLATWGLALSPKIELSNMVVSTQSSSQTARSTSTYDNRVIGGGLILSGAHGTPTSVWDGLYGSVGVGRVFSKVTVDESGSRTFRQSLYSGISGTQWTGEVGSWIPLKPDFGLTIGFVGSSYKADQSRAEGTFQGEELAPDDSLALVSGSRSGNSTGLAPSLTITTYAAKVGVLFQF